MGLFRPVFFFVLAFFAAVALFIGAVTLLTSLQNGAISVSYTMHGRAVEETWSCPYDARTRTSDVA